MSFSTDLDDESQNFYIEKLNTTQKDFGIMFAEKTREEFENDATDIKEFEQLIRTLIAIRLIEIENDERYDDVQLLDTPLMDEAANLREINLVLKEEAKTEGKTEAKAEAKTEAKTESQGQPQDSKTSQSTRELINIVASSLNRTPESFEQYAYRLELEFLVDSNDLRELTDAEWESLKLPLGIVKRLKKLINQKKPVQMQEEETKGEWTDMSPRMKCEI